MKKSPFTRLGLICVVAFFALSFDKYADGWQSNLITVNTDGSLIYNRDEQGNILPDFSRVGYHEGDKPIPLIPIVKTITPPNDGDSQQVIQDAIDEVAKMPADINGFRGTVLLKKGIYKVSRTLHVITSGIILKGEGSGDNGTVIIATETGQRTLLNVGDKGNLKEIEGTRVSLTDSFVPIGINWVTVKSSNGYKIGDKIILYRPGTESWIHDIKMDQIVPKANTKQWQAKDYDLTYERVIKKIEGNKIFMDNPVVMQMDSKYGGGAIYKYTFSGRINEVGVEDIRFESEYTSNEDENHGWVAVGIKNVENGWVRNVSSRYFGYSCVRTGSGTRNITVVNCTCTDAKSQIIGGRRYSFDNGGQLNLFMNCHTEDGRHDYVTDAKICGPNVFYNCTSTKTHADIGPHQRWSTGTLYDNIITDGEINVQDRGNSGSGHGWSGVTQIFWNCTASKVALQMPWVSGQNYCIGLHGSKEVGHFKDRKDGYWEGQNKKGLMPGSLYIAQFKARHL